ncbi:cytochrome b5 [Plasmopara halstedii]|uniref:Cytochrome b5 n=1 Tax=Plasmopara halstedii TaxID=4781 RepID=A0A0P1B885_PLAHL|nr:cytochrome b5 [Plasmopara halstedii]CEG50008.1 cytochrome b5 [Plasmopara halstedii]|eukprot:XP_024586377.1 cytochrome b5 [Plasmopara halstedii]
MSSSAAVSKGNRVAQFIVTTAVISILYQIITRARFASDSTLLNSSSSDPRYRTNEDPRRFTSSEIAGFLLFLGLFGLLQRKTTQERKTGIEAKQLQLNECMSTQSHDYRASKVGEFVTYLPCEVLHELLLMLSPRDLTVCLLVSKSWNVNIGNGADMLWRRVFERDFGEPGDRFAQVFPIECWRHFYFRHHLSRAVELARLLGITHNRKCVVIKGQVYDVTDFLYLHPGGIHVIGDAVGTDATLIWDQFMHSNEAEKSMQTFLVHDHVLNRPKHKQLQGNLEVVKTSWRKISWALSHSNHFGHLAPQFANAVVRYHSRVVTYKVTE